MKKVTYFDVEYANNINKSICQIGLMCENFEDGEPVYPELDIYVNPNDEFDTICSQIHGICGETIKNALDFPKVWSNIEKYFTNSIIIGHNVASADLDALIKSLTRYNIDIPELYYVDTLEIAREVIPSYAVNNYKMSTLCDFFGITIDNEHNAFDDACANSDLLKALMKNYSLKLDGFVRRYYTHNTKAFVSFVSNPIVRKSISEFYGTVTGIVIDKKVKHKEYDYIVQWKENHKQFDFNPNIHSILCVLDKVIEDSIITAEEMELIRSTVKNYLDDLNCSQITLATQVLAGILKGISCDKEITQAECVKLREWLYDNNYLRGHFPFDKIMSTLDNVLSDDIVTQEETNYMLSQLDELLNPVENLKGVIYDVKDKHICLSGNFAYGQKSAVEQYISQRGGIVEDAVKKSTEYLIVGTLECDSYSNGKYGTKVKKAIEYNQKGCNITILKESDFFLSIK